MITDPYELTKQCKNVIALRDAWRAARPSTQTRADRWAAYKLAFGALSDAEKNALLVHRHYRSDEPLTHEPVQRGAILLEHFSVEQARKRSRMPVRSYFSDELRDGENAVRVEVWSIKIGLGERRFLVQGRGVLGATVCGPARPFLSVCARDAILADFDESMAAARDMYAELATIVEAALPEGGAP